MKSLARLVVLLCLQCCLCACVGHQPPALEGFSAKNAQAIALSPYYLDETDSEIDLATQVTRVSAARQPFTGLLQPTLLLVGTVADVITGAAAGDEAVPVKGCRGSYLPQFEQPGDGTFSGSLVFSDFSPDCGSGMERRLNFHGRRDVAGGAFEADLKLAGLELRVGERRFSLAGEIELHGRVGQPLQAEVNLELVGPDQLRHRFRDLQLTWDRLQKYPSLALNGDIVHGRNGACRVETESPLLLSPESGLPFDGMLRFHAGNGSWARLFFPMAGFPGKFRIDSSSGMQTMGKL